jgi:GxxExxY protein
MTRARKWHQHEAWIDPLPTKHYQITSTVIDAAIRIHREVGPGILESAYFECLCFELALTGLRIETQKALSLVYREVTVRCAYRADIVVEQAVVLEVKAIDRIAPIHSRQLYTYLRVADCRVGLVLNFSAPTMLDGIRRAS